MKIIDIRATPVTVPMIVPLRWSMGVETGTTRTLIEVLTDEGLTGVGETYGGQGTVKALQFVREMAVGSDPLAIGPLLARLQSFRIAYETHVPAYVIAGFEIACWDLLGKARQMPVATLLGGAHRVQVPVAAYPFYSYADDRGRGEIATAEAMVEHCTTLVEKHGFGAIKLKGGVLPPPEELRTLRLLRDAFPDAQLRFDPNAAWSVETAILYLRQMEPLHLEYVEDPTWNLEGMSLVRKDIPIPFATNMCVTAFEHIPPAVRLRAVDIILADVHYWGGLRANQRLAGVAETFQLGLGMHSDRELGVSTAAMVHFAAATPYLSHAIDSHYHYQVDDVITIPWEYRGGMFHLPTGPGLGVSLDADKVAAYHRRYLEEGDVVEFLDPRRPNWIPTLPIF
jgi:glucarate dehydratase